MVGALRLLGRGVPVHRLGTALGVFVAGLPAGTVVAFDVLSPLAGDTGWRAASVGAGVVVAACWALYLLAGVDDAAAGATVGPVAAGATVAAGAGDRGRSLGGLDFRLMLALVAVGYATIIAFTTWAPTQVAPYGGLPRQTAVLIASILLAADIPFAPAWGWVSDRLGRRKPFLVLAFLVFGAGAPWCPWRPGHRGRGRCGWRCSWPPWGSGARCSSPRRWR